MESIKTYKAILLAVLGLVIVVGGAYWYMKDNPLPKEAIVNKTDVRLLEGEVTRVFEGDHTIFYSLDIPEMATSTIGMDGALVKVIEGNVSYASMYFSYEGGRGYMPQDYIRNVIVPRVPALIIMGTTTIGSYTWTIAQSDQSEWHVGQVGDGSWLLVVESKRSLHERVIESLESLMTK